ncbi:EFR1 family ferrodoxin [Isachenkonia alkalipeptolytica]|uniref:4Fe-4S ferredoxin n=1 Tax=Isachenkonia alkalipeptolytica TaxID=2565777 RepID=A0AA43XI75_9CLOT|nr:EFR1 family ferrodoxin [Isachenkonia alkalipeptolytica]NBG87257.1 4Fe-4S ferredoxin [Isachenkonia alkalipeptolytica]
MIYYFTGTGNSYYVAKVLGINLQEKIENLGDSRRAGLHQKAVSLTKEEVLGFVFPVYAWGPPRWVLDFIKSLDFEGNPPSYTFAIATCGENIGNTMTTIKQALKEKNIELNYGYSVKMPNNYLMMGSKVETGQKAEEKIRRADTLLSMISEDIKNRGRGFNVNKGFMPSVLSKAVNPLFSKFAIDTKKFRVNDHCISCGLCRRICNTQTIELVDGKPVWGSQCVQCVACINYCPVKAINYGRGTKKKQRYKNPRISPMELEIKKRE